MTRKLFFWWTKTKRCWSSCTFPFKGNKNSPGYYHFKEVCAAGLNCCYFFLIRQTQHFYLLDHCFSGHRLSFSPLCQHASFIYCAKYMWTHIQAKAFVGTRGETICHKTFPNFFMYHCKQKLSFCPKLSPCNIPKGKLIPLSKNTECKETFLRKQ